MFNLFYFKEILEQPTPTPTPPKTEGFVTYVRKFFGLESNKVCLEVGIFFNFSCRLLLTNLCYVEAIKATAFIIKDTIFVSSKE